MTDKKLKEIKARLDSINNYTSWNSTFQFTPAMVELLIRHIAKCHVILDELMSLQDYELPYRVPPLIEKAIQLKKEMKNDAA